MSLTSIAVSWPVQLAGPVKNQSTVRQSRQITRTRRGFLIASSVAVFSCLYFIRTGKFLHPAWLQFSNSHSKTTDFYIKLRGEKTGLLRQDGGYGMAQQECTRHGLFRKLVLHRMCLCRTAQDRAVLLSENSEQNSPGAPGSIYPDAAEYS